MTECDLRVYGAHYPTEPVACSAGNPRWREGVSGICSAHTRRQPCRDHRLFGPALYEFPGERLDYRGQFSTSRAPSSAWPTGRDHVGQWRYAGRGYSLAGALVAALVW